MSEAVLRFFRTFGFSRPEVQRISKGAEKSRSAISPWWHRLYGALWVVRMKCHRMWISLMRPEYKQF